MAIRGLSDLVYNSVTFPNVVLEIMMGIGQLDCCREVLDFSIHGHGFSDRVTGFSR